MCTSKMLSLSEPTSPGFNFSKALGVSLVRLLKIPVIFSVTARYRIKNIDLPICPIPVFTEWSIARYSLCAFQFISDTVVIPTLIIMGILVGWFSSSSLCFAVFETTREFEKIVLSPLVFWGRQWTESIPRVSLQMFTINLHIIAAIICWWIMLCMVSND